MAGKGWNGKGWNAVWIGLFLFGFSQQMLTAQAGSSTRSGVYTADQAQQGKAIYDKQCATCHGATLQGKDQNPPLAGNDFLNNWVGQSVADLGTMIRTTMPATKPGSLTQAETTQLLAYILSANKFPTGETALPRNLNSLKAIRIRKPQAKS